MSQDKFWSELQQKTSGMDLRPDERLCSIALIKRMFPTVSEDVIGWTVYADRWPSTPYVAAIPWLKVVLESSELISCADKYAEAAIAAAEQVKRNGVSERIFGERGKGIDFLSLMAISTLREH